MGGKKKEKVHSRTINVEIAPGNQARMIDHIETYNARPDRRTPKLKYTDVVNDALDRYLEARLAGMRAAAGRKKKP